MTAGLFEVRPFLEDHDRKITTLERDIVLLTRAQTDLKIDVVEAGENNKTLIIDAIEINRKFMTGIAEDIHGELRRMNRLLDIKLAALTSIVVAGLFATLYLLVG